MTTRNEEMICENCRFYAPMIDENAEEYVGACIVGTVEVTAGKEYFGKTDADSSCNLWKPEITTEEFIENVRHAIDVINSR